ncbi:MAG: hypothetical protein L3K15_05960 [Thermoplasmata archaeon]|nr:hypothetical protein [Thermoplasmata archaeon]
MSLVSTQRIASVGGGVGILLIVVVLAPGGASIPFAAHPGVPGWSALPAPPNLVAHPAYLTGELQHAVWGMTVGTGHPSVPRSLCAAMLHPLASSCGPSHTAYLQRPSATRTGWSMTGPNPPSEEPTSVAMAYDGWDQYVLMIGLTPDSNTTGELTNTWAYQGGNWTAILTTGGPVACSGSSLAYDSEDGYVVYFGGKYFGYSGTACPSAGQTWTYRAGVWTQLAPTVAPVARSGGSFADDPADGYMVLFGGESSYRYGWLNDTWEFLAGSWTKLVPATSPANRSQAGMAYDAKDGYLLLFGGMAAYYTALNDTWNFSRGSWNRIPTATSPPVPQPDAFSYDAADQEIIYTTAFNWNGTGNEVTWSYAGGVWAPVNYTVGPPQRLNAETAYDARDGYLFLFGGLAYSYLTDSWSLVAGAWTNRTPAMPAPRVAAATTYDAADGYVLLFGGNPCRSPSSWPCADTADTWTYARGVWTQLSSSPAPSARERAGLVYDAADGYVLLFGGWSNGKPLNDTWEFLGGAWTNLTPASAPSPRSASSMVYDTGDGYVLLFGGDSATLALYSGNYRDTWSFHSGAWTNRTGSLAVSPPAESTNPLVYDATDGYVVMFGIFATTGSAGGVSQNFTWTYSAGAWTNVSTTVGRAPPPRDDASVIYDTTGLQVLLFGGGLAGGAAYGDTWTFLGGRWSELFPTLAPFSRMSASFVYDTGDRVGLLVGGTSFGASLTGGPSCDGYPGRVCADRWAWGGLPVAPLFVASFRSSPVADDLGITAQLTASVVGGSPPYSYGYTGLPPGCSSTNGAILNCAPTATGTYQVNLSVTDSAGNHSFAALALVVNPDPAVTTFVAAPATVTVGNGTVLHAQLSGGTAPFAVAYLNLPTGCSSNSTLDLPCTPTTTGTFHVTIRAIDADGVPASQSTTLDVRPAGSGGPSVTAFIASPGALVLGNGTTLSVTVAPGSGTVAFAFSGLPPGCATSNVASIACRPTAAGTFLVKATVSAANGTSTTVGASVTVTPAGGGPAPLLTAFSAEPNPVVGGQTTILAVLATDSSGPLAYRYAGLPGGCLSANVSQLPCTPWAAGSYRVEAVVTNPGGFAAGVFVSLEVTVGSGAVSPSVTSFLPSPSSISLGASTVLFVTATRSYSPFTYSYGGLPPGCFTADTPTLPCTPTSVGVFYIEVNVTNAGGGSAYSTTILTVHAASSGTNGSGGPSEWTPYLLVGVGVTAGVGATALVAALALLRRGPRTPVTPGTAAPASKQR